MSDSVYYEEKPVKSCPPELYSNLDGCQEVPEISTWGSGQAWLQLTPEYNALSYTIQVKDLSGPIVAAHFHLGAKGTNGPVLETITFQPLPDGVWVAAGVWAPLDPVNLQKLLTSGVYINVHTENFPDGEIRGQVYPRCSKPRHKPCPPKKKCYDPCPEPCPPPCPPPCPEPCPPPRPHPCPPHPCPPHPYPPHPYPPPCSDCNGYPPHPNHHFE